MKTESSKENPIVRPETPKGEDPARLNNLNPDNQSNEIARNTDPKQSPEKKKQEQGKVRSPRAGREPGAKKLKPNRKDDKPTNPPHNENEGELWATEKKGNAADAKA